MSYRFSNLKAVYSSETDDILREFYIPSLSQSVRFDRAVGFFSASMISLATQGLTAFIRNNGRMRLLVGAVLDERDREAISKGYKSREEVLIRCNESLTEQFIQIVQGSTGNDLIKMRWEALSYLVEKELIEIKVALRAKGMFHAKIGIMTDELDNVIVFQGSANDSLHALESGFNYEVINVFRSWNQAETAHSQPYKQMFEDLWNGNSKGTITLDFPKAVAEKILELHKPRNEIGPDNEVALALKYKALREEKIYGPEIPVSFEIRPHQRSALNSWKSHNFQGIFNMATGAGKTLTAIYGAAKVFENRRRLFIVIAVPYQNLVEQWVEELRDFNIFPVKCFGGKMKWLEELNNGVNAFISSRTNFEAVVVVNKSFLSGEFQKAIHRVPGESLLFIGDECHYHGTENYYKSLPSHSEWRMGLSATYERYGDQEGTARLEDFYGDVVYTFGIEEALSLGVLCPYEYHIEIVELTDSEYEEYQELSDRIAKALASSGGNIDRAISSRAGGLELLMFERSRILGSAKNKLVSLIEQIKQRGITSRTLIYCGDGSVGDEEINESSRQIDAVTSAIDSIGYRASRYTSRESSLQRQMILKEFNQGNVLVLAAIRCLDEGVDIPACQDAYILASSRNPRQYIQRRGRVLRKAPGKDKARIFDFFIRLPNNVLDRHHERKLIEQELKRVKEFAEHSVNFSDTVEVLNDIIAEYGLQLALLP
ncbi:MAG: DEAD/DEAH box helicase family protein [Oligoflexus sp.]